MSTSLATFLGKFCKHAPKIAAALQQHGIIHVHLMTACNYNLQSDRNVAALGSLLACQAYDSHL